MQVKIKTLVGKQFILRNLDEDCSIDKVKEFLQSKTGIPLQGQKLVHKGNIVQKSTLKEAGIKDGDFLVVVVPKKPSAKTTEKLETETKPLKEKEKEKEKGKETKEKETKEKEKTNDKVSSQNPLASFSPSQLENLINRLLGSEGGAQNENSAATSTTVDPLSLQQLTDMGFQAERAKKALLLNRMNTQAAMDWLLEHNDDPDIDEPIAIDSMQPLTPDPVILKQLTDMGFSTEDATSALRACNNNQQEACAWLLGDRDLNADSSSSSSGSGSGGGIDENNPIVRSILNDPSIQAGLSNPRVLQAFQEIIANPSSASQFLNDPEIAPVLLQVHNVINDTDW